MKIFDDGLDDIETRPRGRVMKVVDRRLPLAREIQSPCFAQRFFTAVLFFALGSLTVFGFLVLLLIVCP